MHECSPTLDNFREFQGGAKEPKKGHKMKTKEYTVFSISCFEQNGLLFTFKIFFLMGTNI